MDLPIEQTRAGTTLRVRVKPNARTDGVVLADGVVKVSVRAAPEDGKANAAVCKVVAKWLGIAPSSVSVASGAGGRDKRLLLSVPAGFRFPDFTRKTVP